MNKLFGCCIFFVFRTFTGVSQVLTVSPAHLDFGVVYENAPDSQVITLTNTLNRNLSVNGIRFYSTYGVPAFSASEQHFTIAPLSDYSIWIKFSPRHNIEHNSEMVIVNDGLRGYPAVNLTGQGRYSLAYYDSSENKSEEALKEAIQSLTAQGYTALGYNIARDSMFMYVDNKKVNGQGAAQNTLECVYTGREAIGYTDRSDCQSNFSFNTEHTFPQSFFNQLEPMKSDLHHLFPSDDLANNYRGDNPFGIVTGGAIWSNGGSKATNALFEPRDAHKGTAARAMLYFVLRYQDYTGFFAPQEGILRSWHNTFLPDGVEKKRNEDIEVIQHNRNPFIDYPQFLERITSVAGNSVSPSMLTIDPVQDTIVYGYVSASTAADFKYVIVNDGNAPVQCFNFSLSDPALTFQSGGNDTILAAGESLSLNIRFLSGNSLPVQAFLEFETDDNSHAAVSIPVYANDSVFDFIGESANVQLMVYPLPVMDRLNVVLPNSELRTVEIITLQGQTLLHRESIGQDGDLIIETAGLPPAVYVLRAFGETGSYYCRFVKL